MENNNHGDLPTAAQVYSALSLTFRNKESFVEVYHKSQVGISRALPILDYQLLDRFVISALLHLPVPKNESQDDIFQANLAFLPVC